MELYPLKQVTIVVEEILKDQIQQEGMDLGASGYSSFELQGQGSRGMRRSSVVGNNVQISFIVPEDIAVKILTHVSRKYFDNYACIAWMTDVAAVRGERYLKKP
jgi:nitrogen regulatory protein P-II 2